MSYWKKLLTSFFIALIAAPLLFPVVSFAADPIIPSNPSLPTITNICPAGTQLDSTGKCVTIVIPQTTIGSPTSGPCKNLTGTALSQCQTAQASASTVQRFNPNVNLNAGNTYGGITVSGVGGAIASCTNVGSFLANTASNFLSSTVFGKSSKILNGFVGGGTAVSTSDQKAQDKLNSIDQTSKCLDGVAYAVAKNTLAQVTNKTLNWVNTGLNGNPLYVQNMDSYLRTIANQQIKTYLQTAPGSDPVFGNALESAIRHSLTGQSDGLLNVTPNTPQAHAYNSFLADFTNGGWASLLNPSNNPIGALFTATDTISQNINNSQSNAQAEVQRNNGFLDMKHCVQYAQVDSSTTAKAISNGLAANPTCLQWVTDTPGSVIASQVQTITNSPIRQLEYADKINEVLGGFFDSFVNSLLSKGLRGSGSAGNAINFGFSSQGDNVVLDSNGNALNINGGDSLGYQSTAGGGLSQNFDISRPQQLRAILQTQYDYLNRAEDAQAALERVVPAVGALDYCIPGPNPSWSSSVDGNWSSFTSSIQQANADDPSTLEKIVGALPVIGGLVSSIFGFGSKTPPQIWSTPGLLNDPVTGLTVQVPRTFINKGGKIDAGTSGLINGLNKAYDIIKKVYSYYDYNTQINSVFLQAAANDPDTSYVYGFLRDAATETSSLVSYNQAASQIDAQYDTAIGQTESNIEQMEAIRKQINAIVAQAKADYIAKRAAAGNPVNMACINQAYVIDNSSITPVARQEGPSTSDPVVQHSAASANYFYTQVVQ